MAGPLKFAVDSFQNFLARLGVAGDKSASDTYGLDVATTQAEVEAAYRTSWFAKIVDIPPEDMTRQWRDWQAEQDQIEAIEAEEMRLGLQRKTRQALAWGRLYGGAAIFIGAEDGRGPAQELDPEGITEGGLKYLHVIQRWGMATGELDRDPLSPTFLQPLWYEITGKNGQVRIHPSRVVRFLGHELPDTMQGADQAWGDSLWVLLQRAVKNADLAGSGIASLIHEARVDVIKVPGLMDLMSTTDYEARLTRRFMLAKSLKSINNVLLLDAAEEWDSKEASFSALPDVYRVFLAVMSGMADIPATRMLGKSPDGMNATGDSDLRNYYDMLASRQKDQMTPALSPIDECLIRSALGSRDEAIYYEWSPLWQETPKEKADTAKVKADTVAVIVNTGTVPDSAMGKAVQNMLIEDGWLPGLDQGIADAEAAGEISPLEEAPSPAEQFALQQQAAQAKAAAGGNVVPFKAKDAMPRTLYVYRPVLNAEEIIQWARGQGFGSTLAAADMHVTIAFSRAPLDWMKVPPDDFGTTNNDGRMILAPGGPRLVESLGPEGAIVLLFASWQLTWRHSRIADAGASWDYDSFQPHITITYQAGDVDLTKVEPYKGRIVLGPEVFEEVDAGAVTPEEVTA